MNSKLLALLWAACLLNPIRHGSSRTHPLFCSSDTLHILTRFILTAANILGMSILLSITRPYFKPYTASISRVYLLAYLFSLFPREHGLLRTGTCLSEGIAYLQRLVQCLEHAICSTVFVERMNERCERQAEMLEP